MKIYLKDPRISRWPLMDSPVPTVAFLVVYAISLIVIKKVMANRKAFELRTFLIVYNFLQVCGSFYIFFEVSCNQKKKKN